MSEVDWRLNPDGRIFLYPVAGWDAAVLGGKAVGIRLHLIESTEDIATGAVTYAPLLLTPKQALELAQALVRTVERVKANPAEPPGA